MHCLSLFRNVKFKPLCVKYYFRPRSTFSRKTNVQTKYNIQPPAMESLESPVGFRVLFKPFVFTVCFSGSAYVCCAIWQYEDMRKRAQNFFKQKMWFENNPTYKRGELRRQAHQFWNNQSEGQKVATVIISLNAFVFLLWKVQKLQPFMLKYFSSNPAMKAVCLPMFLSTFSHYNFLHMAANMYVLYSFSSSSVAFLGPHQFVALYCSGGVISSFTSCVYKVLLKNYVPSLGASGALMGILSFSCFQYPNAQLALIFFPFFTVSAGHAIKFVMALDFVGMLARWRFLDHAAHLGGACYGILYFKYGGEYIWGRQERVVSWWHNLREKIK